MNKAKLQLFVVDGISIAAFSMLCTACLQFPGKPLSEELLRTLCKAVLVSGLIAEAAHQLAQRSRMTWLMCLEVVMPITCFALGTGVTVRTRLLPESGGSVLDILRIPGEWLCWVIAAFIAASVGRLLLRVSVRVVTSMVMRRNDWR